MSHGDSGRDDLVAIYQRARHGDQDAATLIYDHFLPSFLRIVRRHLHRRLHTIADHEDFVQDGWLALLKAPEANFTCSQQLVKYLETTVRHRVLETNRKYLKFERHDLNREQHFAKLPEPAPKARYTELEISAAQWDFVLSRATLGQRAVLLLLRQGQTYEDISAQMGLEPETLRRICRRIIDKHLAVAAS